MAHKSSGKEITNGGAHRGDTRECPNWGLSREQRLLVMYVYAAYVIDKSVMMTVLWNDSAVECQWCAKWEHKQCVSLGGSP